MNKKREAEMSKLKRDLEEQQMYYESQLLTMKKKNQDAINELSDQIDILTKTKSKYVAFLHANESEPLFDTYWKR